MHTQEASLENHEYILSCNTIGVKVALIKGPSYVVLQSTCAAAFMADLLTWPFCRCQAGVAKIAWSSVWKGSQRYARLPIPVQKYEALLQVHCSVSNVQGMQAVSCVFCLRAL